ncbi:uncharacterized protein LOC115628047 isoform X2 [Scaptodrosophila lebanonensis]|uniref:Uncharacterized protein LOC115628047 isoform X2 n=1 Tax=Drosophila lebanonensis TaxID=7225 RepID=A0A6J2TXG3_DROLE|nr:uncharacterized protein LOC115628047 isoform X2 [Scaptodrosophila lebanonensis]
MGVARVTRGAASMLLLTGLLLLCLGDTVNAYSKYGRGCGDIGCLPNEECVITSDSCSYNQRDGKDCGNYPTCKRKSGAGGSTQTSSVNPSGSVLNPGYPMHGLQPVNPYNPPFVFGQLPFYGAPGGTGGPPGGSAGILGGSGGGLAPYGSNYQGYQNPNMYNKPPPQYQNQNQQNPYNRQTQAHPSGAARLQGRGSAIFTMVSALLTTLLASTLRST